MKKLYVTAALCLLLAGIVTGHDSESEGHDNMCQEPHVGTALSGWWCDSPEDWENGYWAHNGWDSAVDTQPPSEMDRFIPVVQHTVNGETHSRPTFLELKEHHELDDLDDELDDEVVEGLVHDEYELYKDRHSCGRYTHTHNYEDNGPMGIVSHWHSRFRQASDGRCVSGGHSYRHGTRPIRED